MTHLNARAARRPALWLLGGLLAIATAVALIGAPGGAEAERQRPGQLWDRTFISTAVSVGGEPRPLVAGTRIELELARERDGRRVIRWDAGCNYFGAQVRVTRKRLFPGAIAGTDIGCTRKLHRQDRWLGAFFASNPRWRLCGSRLRLRAGETVIRLRAKRE